MEKAILLLPNGLKLSVGDKTNVGIIDYFDNEKVYVTSGLSFPFDQIIYVKTYYEWVNALGEKDYYYEGEGIYYVLNDRLNVHTYDRIGIPNKFNFSKRSDAEKYIESLKPKEEKEEDVLSCDFLCRKPFNECVIDFAKEACKRQRVKDAELAEKILELKQEMTEGFNNLNEKFNNRKYEYNNIFTKRGHFKA